MERKKILDAIIQQSNLLNHQITSLYYQYYGPLFNLNDNVLPFSPQQPYSLHEPIYSFPNVKSQISNTQPLPNQALTATNMQYSQLLSYLDFRTNPSNSPQITQFLPRNEFLHLENSAFSQYKKNLLPPPAKEVSKDTQKLSAVQMPSLVIKHNDAISKENEDNKVSKDIKDSLPDNEKLPEDSQIATGATYKCRNVFKSIIRHMYSYSKKNAEILTGLLMKENYQKEEIEQAYIKLSHYNDIERRNGVRKQSKLVIKEMVSQKSIFTHILKICLEDMLGKWDAGKLGRVSETNFKIYKDICSVYYKEALKLLAQPVK